MPEPSLSEIFSLHGKLGDINFAEVVHESCGYNIIPMEMTISEDLDLLGHLQYSLNNFIKISEKSGSRFRGERINDVGKKLETLIEQEIRKTGLEITKLSRSGYPDFELKQRDRVSYLEIKTTGNIRKEETQHRMFYFSTGTKITSDARHLLLQIQMKEEESKYWKVVSWELRDLCSLKVRLKTEFNAGFKDFNKTPLLCTSSEAPVKAREARQSKLF